MIRLNSIAAVVWGPLAGILSATAQDVAAPAPGSPATYVMHRQLADTLKEAIAKPSDPALSEIGVNDQYSIHEVHRGKAGPPALHVGWTELHFILNGSATFVTGGKIIPASAGTPSSIEGGVSRHVTKGDAIIVPPNTPHWYQRVDKSMTYLEVRFIAPVAAIPPH
jgi:mannose-6-phosphate isomerase-like protein (cupin superfamily)